MRTDERGDATFGGLLVAVAVVIFGLAVNSATWLMGQVETNTGGTAGVVISGTAVTASVGGIVYIARKMISGELVARGPAESEERLLRIAEAQQRQLDAGLQREDTLRQLLVNRATGDQQ